MATLDFILLFVLIIFYFVPMFHFIKFKLSSIFAVVAIATFSFLISSIFSSPNLHISSIEIFSVIVSCLIIHSLYKKSLPFELKSNLYDINFNTISKMLTWLIVAKYLIVLLTAIIVGVINLIGYHDDSKQAAITQISESNSLLVSILLFVSACFIAPITEEYAIRYFLYGHLLIEKCKLNKYIAAIFSSIIFAVLHDSLYGITNAFVGGLFLTWIYHKYGLWYSIIAHLVFNLISFILITLQ